MLDWVFWPIGLWDGEWFLIGDAVENWVWLAFVWLGLIWVGL